jgi:hypothetical protein
MDLGQSIVGQVTPVAVWVRLTVGLALGVAVAVLLLLIEAVGVVVPGTNTHVFKGMGELES